ncbi:MAG: DUF503 domain-containing protein [candidate division WOR-3 bacterium]
MLVALLELDLALPGVTSLKEKRMALNRIKDKVSRQFRVSIAEIGDSKDSWGSASMAVVAVSDDGAFLSSVMAKVIDFIERERGVEITRYSTRFIG